MRPFKRARPVVLALMLVTTVFLHAQTNEAEGEEEEEEGGINIESDWSRAANLYTRGDQTFNINLGLAVPLFFTEQSEGTLDKKMNMGGMASLSYNFFLGPNWFLGGEIDGMFAATEGENMFFMVPLGFRIGYQFILDRFEFPLSFMLGGAGQSHNQRSYFGLFAKPSVGAYFRFNTEWSFGLNTALWWVPEWTGKTRVLDHRNTSIHVHGFFWEISAGVRYHF